VIAFILAFAAFAALVGAIAYKTQRNRRGGELGDAIRAHKASVRGRAVAEHVEWLDHSHR
jgi:hypothetical protein